MHDTIVSVREQALPSGWRLEWLVQEDGAEPTLQHYFTDIDYVHYEANHERGGIALTRNAALLRATGELVQVLDHDDVLLPGALAALIPHFVDHAIHWAVGQADDLMPDGRRISWESTLPFGVIKRGMVNTIAIERQGNWPVHCAGLMMRTDAVRALGGWVASPSDEDIALFAALAELADGYNEPAVTWLYRQHHGQTTRSAGWHDRSGRGRTVALQRVVAVRSSGLTLPYSPLVTDETDRPTVGPAEKELPGVRPTLDG